MVDLAPGSIAWVDLDGGQGREQGGRRPAMVISSSAHLLAASEIVIVVPCTSRDRGWINHVAVEGSHGLPVPSFAMTEQPRTIARSRIKGSAGTASPECLSHVRAWVARWTGTV